MKRIYYLVIFLFILFSFKSESSIQGVWMTTYRIEYPSKEIFPIVQRSLFEFSENKVFIKSFSYPFEPDYNKLEESNYKLEGNKLSIDSGLYIVKTITEDSLVLYIEEIHNGVDIILKRLKERSKKELPEIRNKAFAITAPNYADSIDFINDTLFLDIGNHPHANHSFKKWWIDSYKSYDFLILAMMFPTPYLITDYSEEEINLKLFHTTNKNVKLSRIKNKREISALFGNWKGNLQYSSRSLEGRNPPPFPYFGADTSYYLNIKHDSIEIKRFNKLRKRKWKFNSTHDFIYFPDRLNSRDDVWKIKELNENELLIEMNFGLGLNSKRQIKYEKQLIENIE